jgi:6-phosphogluconolactonase
MKLNTQIFQNAGEAAIAVAELIKNEAINKASAGKKLNIAVSGGSTPRQLFTLLGDEYENKINWVDVRFFWVDERCVEPTDQESNFGMTYDVLLQRTFIPSENIFRMKGEDIPENEAERYQKVLWNELPVKHKFPVFDIVLLGMGEDGHTASIFPNDMGLLNSEFAVAVAVHPVTGQKRITLTGNTIANAESVVFLITGENKAEIIRKIIQKDPESTIYPAAHIPLLNKQVSFYLDKAAAKKL